MKNAKRETRRNTIFLSLPLSFSLSFALPYVRSFPHNIISDLHRFFAINLKMFSIIVLFNWICVVLFVLGFIGNLLGFVVFSSRRFRCCSTYATLALTSFTINFICIIRYSLLLHSSTRKWLSDYLVSYHWLTCKIFRLSSAIRVLAAWVTVLWVIERFLYVSIRLNLFAYRRERFARLEKYKYFGMISLCLLMTIVVSGPTVYFYAPIPIR